ncbi:MAG: hypothetical protein KAG89_19580 [Fulvimarina manganoxydans]|uniref:hypothetical protein n=1 Tax=Fulvimarina manganoxydans TaxID=937218 RepID=UPI002353E518|nr:hypothetical protein [Fulvimarina manganoxydans]MCK5934359.1 hypothetical protein [Fulvimarina manganoxydans]
MADDLGDLLNSSKKMIGTAVGRIVSNNGSRHIGFVYEWNTGEFENAWFGEAEDDVAYEMFAEDQNAA